ncbi:sulfatase-like hydrolase/transferase [Auraticoccus sp. F435]|uniref:Sulfatase-like hydrolase/transferase n=1 Tax=Auraticoccus cholistanensis TaxID=2656650 RepID=A0A6A9UY86_9ACTN|nr:arylsulfatase [Auraticoccus cholistanensis]MVA76684.1 sulfatase-like hydrolase/transferase [Auraticoccus cholistanensis]
MSSAPRPNIVVVLVDDMGFSDIGCYGGEVLTPNIDALAAGGLSMTQFYNTARCSPSRASLMTGLHPHQTGIGILNYDDSPEGYPGTLNRSCVTLAEVLRPAGYATYISGKWHMSNDIHSPDDAWPTRRGFDEFFGTLEGAGSFFQTRTLTRNEENVEHLCEDPGFYYTDAITDHAVEFLRSHAENRADDPFFLYVAYTAPHWPLHALEEDIARYAGRFAAGWDELRVQRLARMVERGIVSGEWALTERDPRVPAWEDVTEQEWEAARMAVYAAQIDRMDQGVGRIMAQLAEQGVREDTLVVFLSDNGGCAEEMPVETARDFVTTYVSFDAFTRDGREVRPGNDPSIWPGGEDTYATYGRSWANLSNTPFREYKHWIHEGGIAAPLVAHWPAGLAARGELRHQPHQLTDIMSTVLEVSGAEYPEEHLGHAVLPPEGRSMLATWAEDAPAEDRYLYWEHEGNCGVRRGPWKLVRKHGQDWELFELDADRTELHDLAADHPARVAEMAEVYQRWAERCGVIPREKVLELYASRGSGLPSE